MALRSITITVRPSGSSAGEGLNGLAASTVAADAALDLLVDAALLVPAIDADPVSEAAVEAIRTGYVAQFILVNASLPTGNVVIQYDTTTVTTVTQLQKAFEAAILQMKSSNQLTP